MTVEKINAIKYPSTGQFRNVCQNIVHKYQSTMVEIDGIEQWIVDRTKPLPKLRFQGTVKLHGTNASIVKYADGRKFYQSKKRILDITHDNSGFFDAMSRVNVDELFDQFIARHVELHGVEPIYPIEIAGEWCGEGVQAGVAISEVPKMFAVFGYRTGGGTTDPDGLTVKWHSVYDYPEVEMPGSRIFNIHRFGVEYIEIDFENPKMVTEELEALTLKVEECCPVGKYFGITGVGEGIVWSPIDHELNDPGMWYKVKGQKHSVTKVRKLATVSPQKLKSIAAFVEYAVTENRMLQGIDEVGLDMKKVGEFIGWVNRDVHKEELDTLTESELTMKDVGQSMSNKARKFYIDKVRNDV